jgi:hypothetical protein
MIGSRNVFFAIKAALNSRRELESPLLQEVVSEQFEKSLQHKSENRLTILMVSSIQVGFSRNGMTDI